MNRTTIDLGRVKGIGHADLLDLSKNKISSRKKTPDPSRKQSTSHNVFYASCNDRGV